MVEEHVNGQIFTADKFYIWGLRYVDELILRDDASVSPTQRLYAMQDANFNLTGVTNTSGTVQERYLFDPYGDRKVMNSSWGVITASAYGWVIGHQGLISDGESGLVYNRARYLHSQLSSFTRRDPYRYADGLNLYFYVRGNPATLLDPRGTDTTIFQPPLATQIPCDQPDQYASSTVDANGLSLVDETTYDIPCGCRLGPFGNVELLTQTCSIKTVTTYPSGSILLAKCVGGYFQNVSIVYFSAPTVQSTRSCSACGAVAVNA